MFDLCDDLHLFCLLKLLKWVLHNFKIYFMAVSLVTKTGQRSNQCVLLKT